MHKRGIRIIIFIMAIILMTGLTGCNSNNTVKEKTPLREYESYIQPEYDMPVILLSEDDYRQAFMCITMKALKGGATYNGIPLLAMSSNRMMEEMKENGYEVTAQGYHITSKTDDYLFEASKNIGTEEDYISGIWLQFFNMDDEDFDWAAFDKINQETSLGISQEIIGKSPYDMMELLGIDNDMLNWLASKEDMSAFWYDNDKQFWYVAYSENSTMTNGGDLKYKFTLSLSRSALDVDESIFIAFDLNKVLTVNYKINYISEEQLQRRDSDYNEWLKTQKK